MNLLNNGIQVRINRFSEFWITLFVLQGKKGNRPQATEWNRGSIFSLMEAVSDQCGFCRNRHEWHMDKGLACQHKPESCLILRLICGNSAENKFHEEKENREVA